MDKLVSMQRTDAEKEAAEEACKAMPCEGPDYPWGLCINLGKDELAKLGVKKLPGVGAEFQLVAHVCVTRVSQSASQDGEDSMGIELQITEMALAPHAATPKTGFQKAASKLYSTEGE